MSQFYAKEAAKGVRYNDLIAWPLPVSIVADEDKNWPDYERK